VDILKVFRSENYSSTYVENTIQHMRWDLLIFDTYGIIKWRKALKDQNVGDLLYAQKL